jgi:hypothetical protein
MEAALSSETLTHHITTGRHKPYDSDLTLTILYIVYHCKEFYFLTYHSMPSSKYVERSVFLNFVHTESTELCRSSLVLGKQIYVTLFNVKSQLLSVRIGNEFYMETAVRTEVPFFILIRNPKFVKKL